MQAITTRSIPLEHGPALLGEGPVGAAEVLGGHAESLRHGLGLDTRRSPTSPTPSPASASSWRWRRSAHPPDRLPALRPRRRASRWRQTVEEAPALRLRAGHRAAGVEQLRRPPLADDAGQDGAGPHVTPSKPTRLKRKATFAFSVPMRMSEAMAMIAPAPAQTPSIAATIGCGQPRIAFTSSPVSSCEGHEALRIHLDQRADDLEHVAAGAEIASRARDHDGLHLLVPPQARKKSVSSR